jgi:subtilisin family serine protease
MLKMLILAFLIPSTGFSAPYFISYRLTPDQNDRLQSSVLGPQGVKFLLKALNEQNENHVMNVLGDSTLNLQSLWISQASIADLEKDQVALLLKSDRIQSVQPVRPLRLETPQASFVDSSGSEAERKNSLKFTWGLRKIQMPLVMEKYPDLTGKGIRVGILDTGLDAKHEAFRNKKVVYRNFLVPGQLAPLDDHGHGTHVAGTIAGYVVRNQRMGIAPDVDLVIGKIFSSTGSSDDAKAVLSLQWMADPDENPATQDAPHVINGSWNADYPVKEDPSLDPFCRALTNLRRLSILSVFAAGNDADSNTIRVPGACPDAITVGSTTESDRLSDFSSEGPVLWGRDGRLDKPDLAAPGSNIESANVGSGWATKSGTSMAAPHVTGAMALLLQLQPDPGQAQRQLFSGANDLGSFGYDHKFGAGRLNLLNSIEGVISR